MRFAVLDDKLVKNPSKADIKRAHSYIPIHGGAEDMVIQSWWVDEAHTKVIDFAYSLTTLESIPVSGANPNPKWDMRIKHFALHGIYHTPQDLRSITIPRSQITDRGIVSLGGWRTLQSYLM